MRRLLPLLILIMISSNAIAETFSISYDNGRIVRRFPENTRPVIGLALSGGGARGFAHIGVIEVLEEKGVRIDRIAGTSMGSIVGGLYAAGYSTDALKDIIGNIDWTDTFSSAPKRRRIYIGEKEDTEWPLFELRFTKGFRARIPSSLSSGQRISSLLSWLTLEPTYICERDFDKLPIPFRAVTTDIKSDSTIVIDSGNLGLAIRASSTIPLLFAPVEYNDFLLVDGGLKNNLPVIPARDMGSDFVIAVAIDESMHKPDELDNPVNIVDQVTSILMRNITRLSKGQADFVITPDMEPFASRNFSNYADMIEQGRIAAEQAFPDLKKSLDSMNTGARLEVTRIFVNPPLYQNTVESIMRTVISPPDGPTGATIAESFEAVWATGEYFSIEGDLDTATGILSVEVVPTPKTIILHFDDTVHSGTPETVIFSPDTHGGADLNAVMASIDSLLRDVRTEGFSFAHIGKSSFNTFRDTLFIEVRVPKVTDITIQEGLKSRNSLIMREMALKVGDVFDQNKLMNSVDNLYGTNLYELVYFDVDHVDGGVGITIHLKEKNWTVARFGLRYNEMFNAEGRLELSRENLLGFGSKLILTGLTGAKRHLIMVESTMPRVYKSFYTFNIKSYMDVRSRPVYSNESILHEYEDERYGTVVSIGQQMDRLGNAMFEFKTETVRTHFAPAAGVKNSQKDFRSFIFRSLIDSYDRYPFPHNGYTNILFIESATEVLGGSEQFVRLFWAASFASTYWRRHTFNGSFAAGTADPSTPDIDAFTLGGLATRLNCYDSISSSSHYYADFPGLAHEERRGTRLAVAKIGYRLFIPRAFHLDLMYSLGNVWNSKEAITSETMLQSYGAKASFSTYFGPLSFGWGITSEGHDRTYLSAGWDF